MAKCGNGREGKGGISPRALLVSARGEAPGPGAERAAWSSDPKVAGSRSPTGAAPSRGRARRLARARVRVRYKCPLCGKPLRSKSVYEHAFRHFEMLERNGALRLSKENGGWVVEIARAGGPKIAGVGWRALVAVAEQLAKRAQNAHGDPETGWGHA